MFYSFSSGGMTNLLYRCALTEDVKLYQDEPRQVLLRFYGPSSCNIDVQVKIFNQLADAGLGPRLYSTFDKGRFEEYLPSSPLSWSQQADEQISRVIAKKIAAIHRLDVLELDRTPNWLVDNYRQFYDSFTQKRTLEFDTDTLDSTRNIAQKMMTIDFNVEIDYLTRLFKSSSVPLVFSHNDLHQNNIIFMHQNNRSLDDRVVLIDFEYCSYNYLTFDLANHLSEWCFDYVGDRYPNFNFSIDRFPSDERQRQFLTDYLLGFNESQEHRERIFGSSLSDGDIIDLLYDDMQTFLMASNLLWCMWAIRSALTSKIKFGYWEMSKSKWDVYLLCKRRFQARTRQNEPSHLNDSIKLQPSRM